jgi:hypothetical protein
VARRRRRPPARPCGRCGVVDRRDLIDHFVGAQQQRLRQRQAERAGGAPVDDQLEARHLLDRQVGRLDAAQQAVGV